jgi:hypothetical protein
MSVILFLDFDGVLRRTQAPLYKLEKPLVDNLEQALRASPDVSIVITSSWREAFTLDQMRAHFSADIARRIVGVTPSSSSRDGFYRHREVLAHLRQLGSPEQAWLALDDDPDHYPAGAPVLVLDPAKGFDREAAQELARRLAG